MRFISTCLAGLPNIILKKYYMAFCKKLPNTIVLGTSAFKYMYILTLFLEICTCEISPLTLYYVPQDLKRRKPSLKLNTAAIYKVLLITKWQWKDMPAPSFTPLGIFKPNVCSVQYSLPTMQPKQKNTLVKLSPSMVTIPFKSRSAVCWLTFQGGAMYILRLVDPFQF